MNKIKAINQIIKMYSILVTYGLTLILLYVWVLAYISDGSIIIYINNYGEALPELVMWIILIPVITYGTYMNFRPPIKFIEHWGIIAKRKIWNSCECELRPRSVFDKFNNNIPRRSIIDDDL